jgi:hypothetical protein
MKEKSLKNGCRECQKLLAFSNQRPRRRCRENDSVRRKNHNLVYNNLIRQLRINLPEARLLDRRMGCASRRYLWAALEARDFRGVSYRRALFDRACLTACG